MSQNVTLYDVLGVGQDASQAEIRSAFRRLTLKYHPDRFPREKRGEAEARFQQITEAFNVLSRKETRDAYDRELSLSKRSSTMDRREIAKKLAIMGAQAYRDGRILEAREHLEQALYHDEENSRAHYFLGLALLRINGQERTGLRHIDRSIQLEPENLAMKAEAARRFLAAGMRLRAQRLAREVLDRDPTNAKAAQVVAEAAGDGGAGESDGRTRSKRRS